MQPIKQNLNKSPQVDEGCSILTTCSSRESRGVGVFQTVRIVKVVRSAFQFMRLVLVVNG